ncbi:hypothetical protein DL93DRAFT_776087 [Clavulina sp. PMI_390]|nr:hypothetical protein DL93DRAFT_776087 [Clavulina sp. PMI_390]
MIVPMDIGSVKVLILSGAEPFEEYNMRSIGDRHLECYIASEADKAFVISMENYGPSSASTKSQEGYQLEIAKGLRISKDLIRPFAFGKLRLKEDDEDHLQNVHALEDIGTIQIIITAVTITQRKAGKGNNWRDRNLPGSRGLSEKTKKGTSHVIQLGNAIESKTGDSTTTTNCKPLKNLLPYRVTFRYAPIEYLWAQEVAPRPSLPDVQVQQPRAANDAHRQESSSSPNLDSVKAERAGVKQEPNHQPTEAIKGKRKSIVIDISSDEDDPSRVLTKRTPSKKAKIKSEMTKPPFFTPGGIIVLSD